MSRIEVIGNATLYLGDCLEVLRGMPDCSVDSIVTDPPYGLSDHKTAEVAACLTAWLAGKPYLPKGTGFMGKTWDAWVPGPEVFRECLRVLKPGGHMLTFAGTRSMDLMSMAIRLAGFELRDSIGYAHDDGEGGAPLLAWCYGSGFNKVGYIKRDDGSHVMQGFGGSLKPAWEPIILARRPLEGTVAANVLAHGTGALNIDGCRIEPTGESRERVGEVSQDRRHTDHGGTNFAATPGIRGGDPAGRWPANVIHDGSDAVLAAFPETASGVMKAGVVRAAQDQPGSVCYGTYGGNATAADTYGDKGSAARFFKTCSSGDSEWLETQFPALIVGSSLSLQSLAVAIAQSDAATSGLPVGSRLSVASAPSTSVTPKQSRQIAENAISAIQRIGSGSWPGPPQGKDSRSLSPVSLAASLEPTGTTTITVSHSEFDGSAGSITFSITPSNLEAGEKDSKQCLTSRLIYCAKASRADRNEGLIDPGPQFKRGNTLRAVENAADAGELKGNTHPTVKPTDLMRYLCRLVTPTGGVVLDPFAGSGSTGKAAVLEGFCFIGIEREAEYIAIARARIDQVQRQLRIVT